MDKRFHMSLKQKTALIAALSLLVTGILLGYSAFGWFTMSKSVTAVGQNLTVEAPSNLEISLKSTGPWESSVEVHLKEYVQTLLAGTEPAFDAATDSFYLMPASSYDGVDMWKTDHAVSPVTSNDGLTAVEMVKADGVKWRIRDQMFAGYYIDVPLYFRGNNVGGTTMRLTEESEIKATPGSDVEKTARVAFLNLEKTAPSYDNAGHTPLVYALEGDDATRRTLAVVSGTTTPALDQPHYILDDNTADVLDFPAANVDANGSCYGSLCVRIWVEGQDERCTATIGNKLFNVKLAFAIHENP